ncbi:MAG: methyltransferase regulatory domain-containing protein, partial [Pirellulaceae bacterium]
MTRTTYDEVPYPSHPMRQTQPDHLATIAHLLGLEPPPPDQCHVLELGCASGGNLIPLALTAPHSRMVGVDLSQRQVAEGQATIAALGLANIELRAVSILDIDDTWGTFDYIVCHGVYSWVPPNVQSKILDIYARHLAPHGIGYVSYNTHPGWHMRGVIRHMLSYHVGRYPDEAPDVQIGRARRLLDFLAHATSGRDRAYATLLQEQAELLRQHSDAYLFHEHLEEHNEPIWFLDFCQRLGERGLRYLAEAEFGMMLPGLSFPEDVQRELAELAPSLLEKEQYMDFVRNRSFRQSLIVHDRCRPQYQLRPERLQRLWVASPVRTPAPPEQLTSDEAVEFAGPDELCLESASPLVKTALQGLGERWPESVPF